MAVGHRRSYPAGETGLRQFAYELSTSKPEEYLAALQKSWTDEQQRCVEALNEIQQAIEMARALIVEREARDRNQH